MNEIVESDFNNFKAGIFFYIKLLSTKWCLECAEAAKKEIGI